MIAYRLAAAAALGLIAYVVASPLAAVLAPGDRSPAYAVACGSLSPDNCSLTLRTAATAGYLAALAQPSRCGDAYYYSPAVLAGYALAGDINRIGRASFNAAFRTVEQLSDEALRTACDSAAATMPAAIKRK